MARIVWRAAVLAAATAGAIAVSAEISSVAASAATVCGSTSVAYAFHGACGNYDGSSGWYGTYGPGFPTSTGWALEAAAAGAPVSPDPTLAFAPGGVPTGVDSSTLAAIGFAFSEADATGSWDGTAQYSADDIAEAAQLLYDQAAWGAPTLPTSGGLLAAYDQLETWYSQAGGATGSPTVDLNTTGISSVPTAGAIFQLRVVFPGSGTAAAGQSVSLSVQGGTFVGGATTAAFTTDSLGEASAEIYADSASTAVSISATATVGALGLQYYDTTGSGAAIVGPEAPVAAANSDTISPTGGAPTAGTVSIDEGGDDVAYLGLAGGVYQVIDSQGSVVATLTTDGNGAAGPSQLLPTGTYTVHEETPPPGYAAASDESVTVIDGGNVTAHFTGANENRAIPGTLSAQLSDSQTGTFLSGGRVMFSYAPLNNSVFTQNIGSCFTGVSGRCLSPPNDGSGLLPGMYEVTEVSSPTGYYLSGSAPTQMVSVNAGASDAVSISNYAFGSISVNMAGNDESYYSVGGAVFSVKGAAPSNGIVGTLAISSAGTSNVVASLQPGTYTLTETHPPPGYSALPPFTAVVALGHTTTMVDVTDTVDPASLDIYNLDAGTSAPIVGGVFDVRYDSSASGVYDEDLGRCTTDSIGACSPGASSGLGLLPGRYEVTEVSAPAGFALDPTASTRDVVLDPGAVAVLDFADPKLVPISFAKHPTGNFDPASPDLAGARFDVRTGGASGPVVATCTTSASGTCTTADVLVAGQRYCWDEAVAPAGFAGGESGCLVASDTTGAAPVAVAEPGEYVAITADKVDAGPPHGLLAGALLDLYRMGAGGVPAPPSPPAGAPVLAGGTWVASATSSGSGAVSFPLELPGYAYCVVEASPPAGYVRNAAPACTPVLAGSTVVPPVASAVTIADVRAAASPVAAPPVAPGPRGAAPPRAPARRRRGRAAAPATVTIRAHTYDALMPTSPIAGAVYDLYVVGPPLTGAPRPRPADPPPRPLAGDTWVGRARTGRAGGIDLVVPDGHAWCLVEVTAPPDFVADPRPHCTTVLGAASPASAFRMPLPERPRMVEIQAHKFNSLQPDTGIPGAEYDVYSVGGPAPGAGRAPGRTVPAGIRDGVFYATGVTRADGRMVVEVPAGHAWCLKEVRAPPGYRFDAALHCTAVLTARSPLSAVEVALPELPTHVPGAAPPAPELPYTGFPIEQLLVGAACAAVAGAVLLALGRRRSGDSRDARPGG